jgi:hypothetical protein
MAPDGWASPGGPSGEKFYATIPNDTTAKYLSKFCDSLGLGGILTWVLDRELDRTKPKGSGRTLITERFQYYLTQYDLHSRRLFKRR